MGEPAGAGFREGGGSCSRAGPPSPTSGPPHNVGPFCRHHPLPLPGRLFWTGMRRVSPDRCSFTLQEPLTLQSHVSFTTHAYQGPPVPACLLPLSHCGYSVELSLVGPVCLPHLPCQSANPTAQLVALLKGSEQGRHRKRQTEVQIPLCSSEDSRGFFTL